MKNTRQLSRRLARQRGEAEFSFFMTAMVVCIIISVSIWILQWVKATKDARVERQMRNGEVIEEGKFYYRVTYLPGICGSDPCTN